jgi:hypothetical protein
MAAPLVVSVPHRLGKNEATRRLKSGLEGVRAKFGQLISIEEETWSGDRLEFRVRAMGQAATGTIDVAEDHARLEVSLPWLLAKAAEQIQRVIRAQGTNLLDKK